MGRYTGLVEPVGNDIDQSIVGAADDNVGDGLIGVVLSEPREFDAHRRGLVRRVVGEFDASLIDYDRVRRPGCGLQTAQLVEQIGGVLVCMDEAHDIRPVVGGLNDHLADDLVQVARRRQHDLPFGPAFVVLNGEQSGGLPIPQSDRVE